MSRNTPHIFTSESVGEGHPDKVADYISDSILDACLAQDKTSRVACETLVKSNMVIIAGELTTKAVIDPEKIARQAIREIGYCNSQDDDVFHADTVFFTNLLTEQSPDIAQGVDAREAEGKGHAEQGAGDQGIMFGFATNETPELLPAPIVFAHKLLIELARRRKCGHVDWLRPDCKSQVAVAYGEDGRPKHIENVVISTQHTEDVDRGTIYSYCVKLIKNVLPAELLDERTEYFINPTGKFVVGGPHGDSGLTGRKIIVDTYGGMGRHGGGAFSGKDPSKVDRSAAYMCRWVAKHIVAAGLADKCELQVAYAIGYPTPVSIRVDTFGTGKVEEKSIEDALESIFSFKPADMVEQLNLLQPIYRKTTHYGHFTNPELPWEQLDETRLAFLKQLLH
ncbi:MULTISPECIES: methionine adenosyltransferase [unclassified Akkermansia]|uniref:methionine adenosyltransferase n=1 Tax=unclassified Akkermansia TaxID=2608915 RepID=UPI000E96BDF2|nr:MULTISPECIES: methionine adenosyltransferase [unclassified Akkermansia]HBI12707.1 methionine adenosyltransferase [Akkermansia sp.]HBN17163.1 methionine adenosyltransferase [Akkermansia sp.]